MSLSQSKETSSVSVRNDGRIVVELSDDQLDRADELAQARNRSYQNGRTADDNFSEGSGEDIHQQGLLAEIAMSELFESVHVDEEISATGDGGIDGELPSGESFDIKSREYDGPGAALLVKKDNVEKRTESPVVYVGAVVDDATVTIDGYVSHEELCQEENEAKARADWLDFMNYEYAVDELNRFEI